MNIQTNADKLKISSYIRAVAAVIGALGYLFLGFAHGDMPSNPTEALHHVMHHSNWQFIHISTIVSVFFWLIAFKSISYSIQDHPIAWYFGKIALISMAVGVTIFSIDYAIDGHSFPSLAKAYTNANPTDKVMIYQSFYSLFSALGATFPLYISFMLGLPYFLAGVATVFSKKYPVWLGWIAIICGLGNFVAGISMFLDHPIIPEDMVFGVFGLLLHLWLIIMGCIMWKQARTMAAQQ
jgi:hypothetical protein